ncbi:hypothetical protein SRHO_G00028230 [Serrasalmus rhombeus]
MQPGCGGVTQFTETLCECCEKWYIESVKLFFHQRNTEKEKACSAELFTALIRSIERSQAELFEVMEEKQKAAEKQAEDLIKELEQEITELKTRDTELEQLSHTEDHLHLLQIYPSLCTPPHTKNWTDISIDHRLSVETVRNALSQLQKSLNDTLIETLNRKIRESVDVTLDADTAHPKLIRSDDGKQVTHGDIEQKLPDNPKRFDRCQCVLGKEGFSSGQFYYAVHVREKTARTLGVALESINRKGKIKLKPQNGIWAVALRNGNEYKARADPSVLLYLRRELQKLPSSFSCFGHFLSSALIVWCVIAPWKVCSDPKWAGLAPPDKEFYR